MTAVEEVLERESALQERDYYLVVGGILQATVE